MDENEDDGDGGTFEPVKDRNKRGRDPDSPDIELIGFDNNGEPKLQPHKKRVTKDLGNNKNEPTKNNNTAHNSNQNKNQHPQKNINYSDNMNAILHKKFKLMYFISPTNIDTTRLFMADTWEIEFPKTKDVIIKTKHGFLLKTDTDKKIIVKSLENLKTHSIIKDFKETAPNTSPSRQISAPSFSVVISRVETEISDIDISNHLKEEEKPHRYCKRIISKATNKPTTLIRIITASEITFKSLLQDGFFYKSCHYPVYPSTPPPAAPKPCIKCNSFNHTTENCQEKTTCNKCSGDHATNKCTTNLEPKCTACNAIDHQAWSFKCPKRPTTPIPGIPNMPIKPINQKSRELPEEIKKSRIHSSITIHDHIINTYINTLNDEKNNEEKREELIQKLRKMFVNNFKIDTQAVFSGTRMYILMFDLEKPNSESPTKPSTEENITQYVS